jgi:CelD/BcsL family acetyltransferase involved in cellulose biosynthesis
MKIERIASLEALERTQEEWDKFLFSSEHKCIFLTQEWFVSWWKSFSEDNSLEILLFRDESEHLIGITPFMIRDKNIRFIASQEVSDYCDFVTKKEKRREFYENLLEYLKMNYSEVERIELINVKQSSPTLSFLPQLAESHGFSYTCQEIEVAPVLSLPRSYESYLDQLDKRNRHELRRKLKRVESLDKIRALKITDLQELRIHTEGFLKLHQNSSPSKEKFWQKKGMTGFFRELIYRFSLKGWIELRLLLYGKKAIAALLNFSFFDRLYFYNSTFDKEYAWYSPGLFLFHQSLKEAIQEQKREADFLRGDEKYKYNFGAKDNKIFQILLRANRR